MSMLLASARPPTAAAVYARAAGVKVGDLADEVGVSASYLSKVLNGSKFPSRQLQLAIARALDIDEASLWPQEVPT